MCLVIFKTAMLLFFVCLFLCLGGDLVSIEDPSEQQYIKNYIEILQDSHSSFWLGLYKNHAGITYFRANKREQNKKIKRH